MEKDQKITINRMLKATIASSGNVEIVNKGAGGVILEQFDVPRGIAYRVKLDDGRSIVVFPHEIDELPKTD